ncbi:hypothetical protein [Legionella waltersii]|uniref:Uncharacterized protein n=1 Tax=Legionella waltersii TaxID=66969 RepID=A0A0W1A1X7_9GAMM|nr:hypothetical protein [Legionella waltersii]KTD75241.1 hypothetical protein Lwal_3282 [Legionella waltersii]SNV06664.1 Uncharacterised protein [Legionella waltersii]
MVWEIFATDAYLLTKRYNSLNEIIEDPWGPALAYAQDMEHIDWINFQFKNFIIRERVLNQVVQINIDGEMYPLSNYISNQPLVYGDFITDRSGPKFGGYLFDNPGSEYLTSSISDKERKELLAMQRQKTLEFCHEQGIAPLPDEQTMEHALSIFGRLHQTQRKLSDFDLTAVDTAQFEQSVLEELYRSDKLSPHEKETLRMLPNLASAIGKTAWQCGGRIQTDLIKEMLSMEYPSPELYKDKVLKGMIHPNSARYIAPGQPGHDPQKTFVHLLIEDVGKTVRAEYLAFYKRYNIEPPQFYLPDSSGFPDTSYGTGIPFLEAEIAQINRDGTVVVSTHRENAEIGDIICDNSSIFGKIFNPANNFRRACHEIAKLGISRESIEEALNDIEHVNLDQNEVFESTLEVLYEQYPEKEQQLLQIINDYYDRKQFMETGLIFEEAGKKESQSQLFSREKKTGKLIGNVSDTGVFLVGALKRAKTSTDQQERETATAHVQMTVLTTLINVARWGINSSNYMSVGHTHSQLSSSEFQQSLNARSYEARGSSGIRKQLGLNNISEEEASRRLAEYQEGFQPVWKAIHDNGEFFRLIDDFRRCKTELINATLENQGDLQIDFKNARDKLKQCVAHIVQTQMPELYKKLDPENNQSELVINSLMNQLEESIDFGLNREMMLHQKKSTGVTLAIVDEEATEGEKYLLSEEQENLLNKLRLLFESLKANEMRLEKLKNQLGKRAAPISQFRFITNPADKQERYAHYYLPKLIRKIELQIILEKDKLMKVTPEEQISEIEQRIKKCKEDVYALSRVADDSPHESIHAGKSPRK